jgi:DNA polymerase V
MIYALVDCNNFFVSCERVFNPKLCNRPVIVLSNNDGCTVARSNEAKQLGIAMGEPYFKIKDLIRCHNVAVLSSNFALYADLSSRVMSIIQTNIEKVEIYSIDEAFLDLSALDTPDLIYKTCKDLSLKIEKYTGIPVSIGIATSRTLAKIANHVAKKNTAERVFSLDSKAKINTILADFKVRDVWGIGRKCEKKLHNLGICTAAELTKLSQVTVKRIFNVNMWRTIQELNGLSCITLADNHSNKKQIMVSRSFGHRITELSELQEALATYVSNAAEKLRAQQSVAGGLYVFMHTCLHGAPEDIYRNSLYIDLPTHSSDTSTLICHAKQGLKHLFRHGYRYQKVGVILCDLGSAADKQCDMFADINLHHNDNLMTTIDNINKKLGRASIQFAAAGLEKSWKVQCNNKSSDFTSSWQGLPIVRL